MAIAGATTPVPCYVVKSLLLILKSNLWVPCLQNWQWINSEIGLLNSNPNNAHQGDMPDCAEGVSNIQNHLLWHENIKLVQDKSTQLVIVVMQGTFNQQLVNSIWSRVPLDELNSFNSLHPTKHDCYFKSVILNACLWLAWWKNTSPPIVDQEFNAIIIKDHNLGGCITAISQQNH